MSLMALLLTGCSGNEGITLYDSDKYQTVSINESFVPETGEADKEAEAEPETAEEDKDINPGFLHHIKKTFAEESAHAPSFQNQSSFHV